MARLGGRVEPVVVATIHELHRRGCQLGRIEIIQNRELPIEDRFKATLKLAEMPRNGSKVRIRNRCEVTGRPRAFYRKLKMSRVALRQLGNFGQIPGIVKSSW